MPVTLLLAIRIRPPSVLKACRAQDWLELQGLSGRAAAEKRLPTISVGSRVASVTRRFAAGHAFKMVRACGRSQEFGFLAQLF